MNTKSTLLATALLVLLCGESALAQRRPAPPSRYRYTFQVDAKSLPKGVTVREQGEGKDARLFIKNESDVPLVIHERFSNDVLVSGTKLVGGKTYGYFPNGVPMEGKTHLKGWQAPFGDIEETLLYLPNEPTKIAPGREAGLGKELPPAEEAIIPAKYDGKPYEIKGTVKYHLNEAYDSYYKAQKGKD